LTGSRLPEKQKTLQHEVFLSGLGLFTGEKCSIKICPAEPNTGIVFQRVDLPGKPEIPATLTYVKETPRCTRLAREKASIHTVEHLLSALSALEVDNARIEVEGPEIPIGDGSSLVFVELIEKAGFKAQEQERRCLKITQPLFWTEGEISLVALPSEHFRISYTIHYPHSPLIRSQYYSFSLQSDAYKSEIASCRTFSLYEEILPLIEKGMIKAGGLENALVIKGDQVLNPGGARFPDEMVRHKVLDLIGDLALIGMPLQGHIIAICSGHSSHVAFAKILSKCTNSECRL